MKIDKHEELEKKIKLSKAGKYITLGIALVICIISIISMMTTEKFDFFLLIGVSLIITSFLQHKKTKKLEQELNSFKK